MIYEHLKSDSPNYVKGLERQKRKSRLREMYKANLDAFFAK